METDIKTPIKFSQPSESTPAKTVLVHISKMESFVCSLNPAASLYEDVTDEDDIRSCFNKLGEYLKTKDIKLITIEDALFTKGKEKELMKLALDSLNYERATDIEKEKKQDEQENIEGSDAKKRKRKESLDKYEEYSSNEYKEKVLKKFKKKNLINVILTRPSIKLNHIERDTFIEPTLISFFPVGNIIFCRDQQITTKKGIVIGRTRTSQRKYEHIIMKQVFENLGADVIGEVVGNEKEGFLEGGDFYVARENLGMLGVGLRTDIMGANYLLEKDLVGTRYMAICLDENDIDQQRMHLDTYFNILNDNNAVVIDFDDVMKNTGKKNIDRRVYYFDNDKDAKPIISDRTFIKNKIGEYKLVKIYDSFYKFLDEMKFNYVKISDKEQKEYMINFLNIGNNTVISVNPNLEKKLKENGINEITVKYFDCQPILNMYGGMHCMTQVSRI